MRINVRDMPEVLYEMRHELVNILRVQAGAEAHPEVAKRLREIADEFETGAAPADARWARQQQKRKLFGGDK